ncbi:hypothetical protein [Ramlibacter sp.]|uniref:hypothetical protein n=1 Tax=Ramlibacter sp. TaxID=1917967 RepID=UPI002D62852F|nr:hypothetical protein [Ramlibacter sp.]HYD76085.1 hypothetical protein [Ramlibacter sp.]
MKRRLFLSGTAASALGLMGCGGGGGGTAATVGDLATGVMAASTPAAVPGANTAASAASGLPERVLACYYTGWDTGRYAITDVPADFNAIYLFHAKPNGSPVNGNWNNVGNGAFTFEFWDSVLPSDVQRCRGRGQRVIFTMGGAQAGFNFDSRSKSSNFIASFRDMADRMGGVDGCDFNNFEANIGSSPAEMIWIAEQLKSLYGQDFAITAPPQPNSPEDRAMLKAMADAGVLSWAAPQYYDWSGFNEPGFIRTRTRDWVNDLSAKRVMVGLSANYPQGPSLDDCIREWDAIKAEHPEIRGMFCWSAQLNLDGGNTWGSTMKARL